MVSLHPWPQGSTCDRLRMHCRKCTSDEPSQSHRYVPVLAYRQFDIIIFSHASLHLPNSPFSSCLVPRTPYSPSPWPREWLQENQLYSPSIRPILGPGWLRPWLTVDP